MVDVAHRNGCEHTQVAHNMIYNHDVVWGGDSPRYEDGRPACSRCISENPDLLRDGKGLRKGITAMPVNDEQVFAGVIKGDINVFVQMIAGSFTSEATKFLEKVASETGKKLLILPGSGVSHVYFYANPAISSLP